MGSAIFLLWFAVAICPEYWPRWWRRPRPVPPPIPDPPGPGPWPPPWQVLLGGLAGVAGGFLFTRAWGPSQAGVDAFYAAVTCIGAVTASILTHGVIGSLLDRR